jgi:hypothetical protein
MPDREKKEAPKDRAQEAERRRIQAETDAAAAFWNEHERRFGTPADEYSEI